MSDKMEFAQCAVNTTQLKTWKLIISTHGAKAEKRWLKTAKCFAKKIIARRVISNFHKTKIPHNKCGILETMYKKTTTLYIDKGYIVSWWAIEDSNL